MWIVRTSEPGVSLTDAWGKPLYTRCRVRWRWVAVYVYWVWKRCGRVAIMMLETEEC